MNEVTSYISQKPIQREEARRGDTLRQEILDLIQHDYPNFDLSSYLSISELGDYRKKYLTSLVLVGEDELSELKADVINSISTHAILTENIEEVIDNKVSFGEKVSDVIAEFGGSWKFISTFFIFMLIWISINIWGLYFHRFDPYPFILLNLILSCLAAIQAPIIMMSQNRLESKDRLRGEHDYKVNLKAELEIRILNEKIDHLIAQHGKNMMDVQQLQTDYLEDILKILQHSNS